MHPSRDRETPVRVATETLGERDDAVRDGAARALIVSDVRLYREALAWRLAQTGRVTVLATAERGDVALAQTIDLRPDVVIVDRAMNEAMSIARAVGERSCAKVVAFAIADVDDAVLECAEAGLSGYVTRDATIDDLVDTIERAVRGEVLCSPRVAATLFRRLAALASAVAPPTMRPPELTQREREIAALVERGLSNKEIASRLAIGTATVKNHVHNILEKLDVSRRGEAAASLRDGRLIPRDSSQLERQI
jgi:two-component system nitrate/nitrite response regulator NarL